jgi:hypothetical protein
MSQVQGGERMSEEPTVAQWTKFVMISVALNILLFGLVIGLLVG